MVRTLDDELLLRLENVLVIVRKIGDLVTVQRSQAKPPCQRAVEEADWLAAFVRPRKRWLPHLHALFHCAHTSSWRGTLDANLTSLGQVGSIRKGREEPLRVCGNLSSDTFDPSFGAEKAAFEAM